ncbi:MAG: hypothetical protein QOF78_4269 [Phycisphaerales bacterium]|jgi:integrative and conjugative element protein (TIGR02256 family)|nr:hypothetical protein [Phycisphaerales bacterium]
MTPQETPDRWSSPAVICPAPRRGRVHGIDPGLTSNVASVAEDLMMFHRVGGGQLGIAAHALRVMHSHRQLTRSALEAGGILLGQTIRRGHEVVIDVATAPGAGDRRTRRSFAQRRRTAQEMIEASWHASGGRRIYLGEWHTHAQDDPAPSRLDRRTWQRIATTANYLHGFLFFIIVGRVRIRVWETRTGGGLSQARLASPS